MCTGAKKLCFILFDILFLRERNQARFELFGNFSVQSGLYPPTSLFMTSKERCNLCIIYAWIMHHWIMNFWIVYHELAQPIWRAFFLMEISLNLEYRQIKRKIISRRSWGEERSTCMCYFIERWYTIKTWKQNIKLE